MTILIKKYIDIECMYFGINSKKYMYKDWKNWDLANTGIIGILTLEIDTESETYEERSFEQIIKPKELDVLKVPEMCDLIVTWNGRDFDIPLLYYLVKSSVFHIDVLKKDRDLMDVCLYANINIDGGLGAVIKRLDIDYPCEDKEVPFYEHLKNMFIKDIDKESKEYKDSSNIVLKRNEFDVRTLPLIEEKFGLLYESRKDKDKWHKSW